MAAPSPVFLLLAALIFSMIGRALLFRAALSISKPWGIAVLCVPFAPFFFRMNYRELAHEGQNWRRGSMICGTLFFVVTGSTGSLGDLWALVPEKLQPGWLAAKLEPMVPAEALVTAQAPAKVTAAAPEVAPAAVSTAAPTVLPPTPVPLTFGERVTANQQEFARLADVYETLKRERGYLRKHDDAAIQEYNTSAAKYQADLAKARAEQTDLMKLVAKK